MGEHIFIQEFFNLMRSEREFNNDLEPEARQEVEAPAPEVPATAPAAEGRATQDAIIYTDHHGFGQGRMLLIW